MTSSAAEAVVLEGPRRLGRRSFVVPEVGPDDGLLQVEACGLCGTDHELWGGVLPGPYPFVPGHEIVGVVTAVGERAAARWGVAAGDRVAVEVFQSCRSCDACLRGDYRRCSVHGLADMYGLVAADRQPGLWGGYAEQLYLSPDAIVLPVPAALDPVVATVFNPLGAGVRWGVTLPGTKKGDIVAVLGPGMRGLSVLAAAKEAGAGFVMVTGAGARDAERLALAEEFGADAVVDVTEADPVATLRQATGGRRADVVVDVTAKAPAAFAQAVELARTGGTVVVAGTRGEPGAPGFAPDLVVYKELRIMGAFGVDGTAYRAALDLLATGRYPFADLPRRTAGLDDVGPLLATMAGEGAAGEPVPIHAVVVPG